MSQAKDRMRSQLPTALYSPSWMEKEAGCYLHGLLLRDEFRRRYSEMMRWKKTQVVLSPYDDQVEIEPLML